MKKRKRYPRNPRLRLTRKLFQGLREAWQKTDDGIIEIIVDSYRGGALEVAQPTSPDPRGSNSLKLF